jgi:hypothetical protein
MTVLVILILLGIVVFLTFKNKQEDDSFNIVQKEHEYQQKIQGITLKEAKALAFANYIYYSFICDCKNSNRQEEVEPNTSMQSAAIKLVESYDDCEVIELALCLNRFAKGDQLRNEEKKYLDSCYKLRSFLFDDNWMMHYMAKLWASWKKDKSFIDLEKENIKTQIKLFMLMGNHFELNEISALDRFRLLISALRWSKQITEVEVEEIRADLSESLAKQDMEKIKSYLKS